MTISVIILNWNGRRHLEICLPALLQQSRAPDEIIVVDNGSSDDSVSFLQQAFPSIFVVALSNNCGFSGGNNAGLARAKGDAIVLLNNDTNPLPDFIEQLDRCAGEHPDAGIIAAHLVDWDGKVTDSAGDGCKTTGRGFARNRRKPANEAPSSGWTFAACAGAALYRRQLIDDIGFLDDDFFLNFEDTDLSARAQLYGWRVWFCREAVVRHRISASQGRWSYANAFYGARNHLMVLAKNFPLGTAAKYSPLIMAEIVAMFFVAVRKRQALAYIRGILSAVWSTPNLWAKRRKIMRHRRVSPREFEAGLHHPQLSPTRLIRLIRSA